MFDFELDLWEHDTCMVEIPDVFKEAWFKSQQLVAQRNKHSISRSTAVVLGIEGIFDDVGVWKCRTRLPLQDIHRGSHVRFGHPIQPQWSARWPDPVLACVTVENPVEFLGTGRELDMLTQRMV